MAEDAFPKIASFKDPGSFRAHLGSIGADLPMDDAAISAAQRSPLAEPIDVKGFGRVGNRWCIHPMEGWDGTPSGEPTEHTIRRWRNFGLSGAKLIWGGEAFAVEGDGRANPNQLAVVDNDYERAACGLALLLKTLITAHRETFSATDDLL